MDGFSDNMTKIVFATGNRGKLREASEILGEGFELVTPVDFNITEEQKNEISHRGKALRAMAQWLNNQ